LSGQLYDPFSTHAVGGGFIRDPIPGNNLATYVSPYTGGSLINSIGQSLINFYPAPLNNSLTNNWSATGLLADYSDEYSGRIDHNFSDRRNTKTKRLLSLAPAIPPARDRETPITAGMSVSD
jgi:hypothetical protein